MKQSVEVQTEEGQGKVKKYEEMLRSEC